VDNDDPEYALGAASLKIATAVDALAARMDGTVSPLRVLAAKRAARAGRMAFELARQLLNVQRPDGEVTSLIDEADRVLAALQGKAKIEDFALIELVRMVDEAARFGQTASPQAYWIARYPQHAPRLDTTALEKAATAWTGDNARQRWEAVHDLAVRTGVIARSTTPDAVRKHWERWQRP
jgi:hypothetical protein